MNKASYYLQRAKLRIWLNGLYPLCLAAILVIVLTALLLALLAGVP